MSIREKSIGARIQLACRARGMSVRRLAEKVGLSHTAVNKYVHGRTVPPSAALIRLSQALDVSIEYLLRPFTLPVSKAQFRAKRSLKVRERKAIEAEVQDRLERLVSLEQFLPPDEVRTVDLPALKCSSLASAEAAAQKVRDSWQLGRDAIANFTGLLEEQGIKILTVEAPPEFDGVSGNASEISFIAIGKGDKWPGDRQRFTLAHELGHLVLKHASAIDDEKLCHRFAGAFLLPRDAMRREFPHPRNSLSLEELHSLKHEYGISMQAILRRTSDLQIIQKETYQKYCRTFSARGWRTNEPGDQIPQERPQWETRLLERLLVEDLISPARAAEITKRSIVELKNLGASVEKAHTQRHQYLD